MSSICQTPKLNPLLAGSIWHDAKKTTQHSVVLGCSICTVTLNTQQMSGSVEEERHSNQVNNEIWTSKTRVINITLFHRWSHSTGCIYSSLAHYGPWQQWIVVHTSLDLFQLDLTPADQFNLLHFRQDEVISFAGKVQLRVKLAWCSPFLFVHTHTHTLSHPPPPVQNLLCLFSVGTSGSLRPGAWRGRCTTVPHV